jgi:argininosuccinate synthase
MQQEIIKSTNYVKVASHEAKKGEVKKAVLLYSGGLDSSCMLKWIQDEYQCEVISLTINLGQQLGSLAEAKKKAEKLGVKKAYVLDCQDEFAEKYLAKAIKANAAYQGDYHLSTPLGRTLLAEKAAEIATKEGAEAIAHGCTGKGNDQVRIEASALCFNPSIKVIAPVREWAMGRDEEMAYAKVNGIALPDYVGGGKKYLYSDDDNMWGVTWEGGPIEDPKIEPPLEEILKVCVSPEKAPDKKEYVKIQFLAGIPVQLNGKKMKLADIIKNLNKIGAAHGVGYTTLIEDRLVGLKVRGVYEMPAAHIITEAHYNLEKLVSTQEENAFKELIDSKWSYLCYNAKWMDPTMAHLNAYIDDMNQKVTGSVTLKLYKGKAEVVLVESANSLFDKDLATFDKNAKFNQNSSAGFIEIHGLAMKMTHQAAQNNSKSKK